MASGKSCIGSSFDCASMQKCAVQTASVTAAADQTAFSQSCGDFLKQKPSRLIKLNFFAQCSTLLTKETDVLLRIGNNVYLYKEPLPILKMS